MQEEIPGLDFGKIERDILLSHVNNYWIDHIDAMDQLRKGIRLRAYGGQTDPVIAYKQEGFAMFDEMIELIQERTIRLLLKCQIKAEPRQVQRIFPTGPRAQQAAPQQKAPEDASVQEEAQPASGAVDAQVENADVPKDVDVDSLKTSGDSAYNPATMKKSKKPGPNDLCPCGSGLKYKKCCGKPF